MPSFTRRRENDLTRTRDGQEATVEWDAYDSTFATSVDVEDHGDFPVRINSVHPDDPASRMRCDRYTTTLRGGKAWLVTAHFSIPSFGAAHTGDETADDPLNAATEIRWSDVQATEAVDRDVDGNAILGSARKSFGGNVSKNINAKRVTISRNQPQFNINTALFHENTVNSAAFAGAQPTEVRCLSIIPTSVVTVNSQFVNVAHSFEFRSVSIWGIDPHQPRILDQGYEAAFVVDNVTRVLRLVDVKGQPPEDEVLLDGHGRPIETDHYTYIDENGEVVASPTFADLGVPPGAVLEPVQGAVFLRYRRYPATDFNQLNL